MLSAEGIAELHAPAAGAGDVAYGMGWVIGEAGGVPAVYRHGSAPNFHSTVLIEPEGWRGVVVLTDVNLLEVWHVGPSSVIAEGVLQLMRGEAPGDGGPSVGRRYLVADVVIGAYTALGILSVVLLPRWRRQLSEHPPHGTVAFARRPVLPILVDANWSLIILAAFPAICNVPSWGFWTLYQPDLAYWLIAIAAATVLKAVARVAWAHGASKGARDAPGWRHVVVASVVVEILCLALFFLVMFASTSPATFVMGFLALVFALELIAQPVRLAAGVKRTRGHGGRGEEAVPSQAPRTGTQAECGPDHVHWLTTALSSSARPRGCAPSTAGHIIYQGAIRSGNQSPGVADSGCLLHSQDASGVPFC